jgi:hypothetical protein
MPVPHVVLVNVAHADTPTQEVGISRMDDNKEVRFARNVGSGITLFLQWEVLHGLGSGGGAKEIEAGKVFRACLAWSQGGHFLLAACTIQICKQHS